MYTEHVLLDVVFAVAILTSILHTLALITEARDYRRAKQYWAARRESEKSQ